MCYFSVIVMKKILKAWVTFLGSLNFLSFASKVGTSSTGYTFPVSSFIMFHVVFILLLDFAVKSIVV